jgi:hypothetical protein
VFGDGTVVLYGPPDDDAAVAAHLAGDHERMIAMRADCPLCAELGEDR